MCVGGWVGVVRGHKLWWRCVWVGVVRGHKRSGGVCVCVCGWVGGWVGVVRGHKL